MALVTDFPRLWRDPVTPQRERKRMVRLLLEDVTLAKADEVVAHIRFCGGATHTLRLPLPLAAPELRKTQPAVVAEIDRLLENHTDVEIADALNARGLRPGVADRFSSIIIGHVREKYGLETRFSLCADRGMLTSGDDRCTWTAPRHSEPRPPRSPGLVRLQRQGERLYAPREPP